MRASGRWGRRPLPGSIARLSYPVVATRPSGRTVRDSPPEPASVSGSAPLHRRFWSLRALEGCTRLGSPRCLREVGRPGGVAEAALLVAARQIEKLVERAGVLVDVRRRVALLPQPVWNGVEPQLGRLDVRDLVPLERAADPCVGHRPDRVARGDRAVARVLVVVDEDPVPLLLPPLAGGVLRQAPLDLARQRKGRAADLDVVPARLDPDVDVDAARARGLRIADQSVLLEDVA